MCAKSMQEGNELRLLLVVAGRLGVLLMAIAGLIALPAFTRPTMPPAASDANATPLQMIVTINGLAQGEAVTLLIGPQTETPEVENPLFEHQIAGTGAAVTEDITVALEDGYYDLLLRAPDHYFREPKGYMFTVRNSTVVNPTGRALTFNLKPRPTYPAVETFILLSAPPMPPMKVGPIPLWARVVEPVAIALAVIVVAAIASAIWLHRSRVSILLWLIVGLVLGAVAGLFVGLPINPEQAAGRSRNGLGRTYWSTAWRLCGRQPV
jgi:hypothetical protein